RLARYLYRDKAARDAIVAQAAVVAKDSTILDAKNARLRAAIDSLSLPIGWSRPLRESLRAGPVAADGAVLIDLVLAFVGWFATALALSLGAPFWFDLLNKFMVIRSTVKPHEKSPEESSEDRQKGDRKKLLGAVPGSRSAQTTDQTLPIEAEARAWKNDLDPQ